MKGLSGKEIEILLLLVKDISSNYNSNNITKKINITSAGAFKAMKNLEKKKLIVGKRLGKAIFYKANLGDYYTFRIIETLLIGEAREKASRWLNEFNELNNHSDIILIYGSIIRDQKKAGDIDLLIISKNKKEVDKIIKERRMVSTKPIHAIKRSYQELKEDLKNKNEIILNIISSCYVLHGYDKLLDGIKNVTSI